MIAGTLKHRMDESNACDYGARAATQLSKHAQVICRIHWFLQNLTFINKYCVRTYDEVWRVLGRFAHEPLVHLNRLVCGRLHGVFNNSFPSEV